MIECIEGKNYRPDWNNGREKNQEPKDINIPLASEAVQGYEYER
jgi:hypothetical protein